MVEEERRKGTGGEQEERTKPEVRTTHDSDLCGFKYLLVDDEGSPSWSQVKVLFYFSGTANKTEFGLHG